jgi:hypothetical protein
MPDPLSVDTRFANLKSALSLLTSRRMRLLRLAEFAEPLLTRDASRFLDAYLHEFLPPLADALIHVDLTGTPPSFGRRIQKLVDALAAYFPDINQSADWMRAIQALNDQLSASAGTARAKESPRTPGSPGRLNGVWLPFVERERILTEIDPLFGTVRLLEVDVRPSSEAHSGDEVRLDGVDTIDDPTQQGFLRALKAARAWAASAAPHTRFGPVKVICNIDFPGQLAGDSLLGGFAAAAACGLLKSVAHREEYQLKGDVAITGSINDDGTLIPVDSAALRVKVEACLHSAIRILVVPREQEAFCLAHLKAARAGEGLSDSPADQLKIAGVSTLDDILNNRLLVSSRNIPFLLRAGRRAWKRRRPFAVLLFAVMALIIARLVTGPLDKVPVTGRFTADQLLLENRAGESIAALTVGERISAAAAVCPAGPAGCYAIIHLSPPSGPNEDLCFYPAAESIGSPFEVRCWSATRRAPLWRMPLTLTLSFPRHSSPVERVFTIRQLIAGDFCNDGSTRIFVLANGMGFASTVLELDQTNGAIRSMYVHVGHLEEMEAIDFNQDGIKELCLCGMNNAYGKQACLVVLDPRNISGHGPLRNEYEVDGIAPAHHVAYVLIPPTVVGNVFRHLPTATKARSLFTTQDGKNQIKLSISDVDDLPNDCFSTTTAKYYLTFNNRIEPTEILTGNDYDKLAENLVEEGKIPFLPKSTPGYTEAFFHTLLYWDGNAWKTH